MEKVISATRNTCFALLSAIECDVREIVAEYSIDLNRNSLLPPDVRSTAAERYLLDNRENNILGVDNDLSLIAYTDFTDLAKMLYGISDEVSRTFSVDLNVIAQKLESMARPRNRVCHSRPLEEDDLPKFYDLANFLLNSYPGLPWSQLRVAQSTARDMSYVLQLQIPGFWRLGTKEVQNNLPLPDFDETSFLGRLSERKELRKHLVSHQKVISIVGEGGVGKSALAIQCLYDIIDSEQDCRFDAVVWVSLKTRVLTPKGVEIMRNAVTDVLGVISEAGERLGIPRVTSDDREAMEKELLEYLKQLRVLLVIDNFETFGSNPLRSFLSDIPDGSKVLITSRVGLGELELRYKLDELDIKTAVNLMRRSAAVLNLEIIGKDTQKRLEKYCSLLFKNPLLIKWFVQSVAAGEDPERLSARGNQKFQEAVKFCFQNLFARLSAVETEILHILGACRRQVTFTELIFLLKQTSTVDNTQIEAALSTLHNSSMLKRTAPDPRSAETATSINLTDIASEFIAKFAPPSKDTLDKVQGALKRLREYAEQSTVQTQIFPYEVFAVRANTRDERICAVYLGQALRLYRSGELAKAREAVERAKEMLPKYIEAYRMASLIEDKAGDMYKASEELETALAYDERSAITHYQYAQHLLHHVEDAAQALIHIDAAITIDSKAESLQTFRALILTRLGRCDEASRIYEQLLNEIAERPRKWRITTCDQASECYRRWAERDLIMKEVVLFKQHIDRSCTILEGALARDDFDDRMSRLFSSVIEGALFFAMETKDEAYAIQQLRRIFDVSTIARIAPARRLTPEILESSFGVNSAVIEAVRQYPTELLAPSIALAGNVPAIASEAVSLRGTIKNVLPDKGFGFIFSGSREWFFHRTNLQNSNEWPMFSAGDHVEFEEIAGQKGVQADKVKLL